jgi:hypothetical protein
MSIFFACVNLLVPAQAGWKREAGDQRTIGEGERRREDGTPNQAGNFLSGGKGGRDEGREKTDRRARQESPSFDRGAPPPLETSLPRLLLAPKACNCAAAAPDAPAPHAPNLKKKLVVVVVITRLQLRTLLRAH